LSAWNHCIAIKGFEKDYLSQQMNSGILANAIQYEAETLDELTQQSCRIKFEKTA